MIPDEGRERKRLAVIIPVFNSMRTLPKLVESLKKSDTSECEILFVDDGSTDESPEYLTNQGFRVHRMPQNAGPSVARNEGIRLTQSPLVLFGDSDIIIYSPDAFSAIIRAFDADPQINTVSTISLPLPENDSFLARFTALNEYLVFNRWIKDRPEVDFWPEISTRFGAYRREILEAINGFDTRIPIASVEDADLFFRIQANGHHGYLLAWVKIGHHWPSRLIPLLKVWIVRAYLWSNLFAKRKEFQEVFATRIEALYKLLDCVSFATILLAFPFRFFLLPAVLLQILTMTFKIPMFIQFRRYHGSLTASGAVLMSQVNSLALGTGALAAAVDRIWKAVTKRS